MLRGADLDKLLDDGCGDAGFNDSVAALLDEPMAKKSVVKVSQEKPNAASTLASAGPGSSAQGATAAKFPAAATKKQGSGRAPVLGATPPPPEGADPEKFQLVHALDQAARAQGYASVEEYDKYLTESGAFGGAGSDEAEQTPLAPGIKKPPAWQVPGAYPGDRNKIGKEYEKHMETVEPEPEWDRHGAYLKKTFVKQADTWGAKPQDGQKIKFRLGEDGVEQTAELGGGSLPWALDIVSRTMKVCDVVEVVAYGEQGATDEEDPIQAEQKRCWRFELTSIDGKVKHDKFALSTDERIELAEQLRLRGNEFFKRGRPLRALDFYEKGSALMDVLEAEDLGTGKIDKVAEEKNQRIWACQKPLLLNWSLILMKHGRWRDAERKCTEVLMDIDKLNVKALFRRGQCNLNLGNIEQARGDLRRARELDTSISAEVDKELAKVDALQKEEDKDDVEVAKKVTKGYLKAGDIRSTLPPPKETPTPPPESKNIMKVLRAQEAAAAAECVDEDTYRRQREAIYNSLLARPFATDGLAEDDAQTSTGGKCTASAPATEPREKSSALPVADSSAKTWSALSCRRRAAA